MSSSPPEPLAPRPLWGGAVEACLPDRFVDVSPFREVPDHQEVLADADEDQSFIFEIVEHDASVPDGPACGSFFFEDLAAAGDAEAAALDAVTPLDVAADLPGLPSDRVSYACVATGRQSVSKGRQSSHAANDVLVVLAVLRLPSVGSDLLVSLNSPVLISEHSAAAADAGAGVKTAFATAPQLMAAVIRSLKVEDWGLFG